MKLFSTSSLHIKHKAPSVSFSQGTEPLTPKLPISLAWVCRRVTRSRYSSAKDQKSGGDIFSKQARGALHN